MPSDVFTFRCACFLVPSLALASSSPAIGPDWVEVGDAGSDVPGAQIPIRPQGATFLGSIAGTLSSGVGTPDFEDLYVFRVTEVQSFSIMPASANFNAVLYLFNLTVNNEALGLLGNDDSSEKDNLPRLVSMSDDGTGVQISVPGDYILAVTGAGRAPISRTGSIYDFMSPTEISGPDGIGGLNPLSGWTGEGEQGSYRFVFTSGDYPIFPTPGSVGIFAVAACGLLRRRR
jgi:hypothetical protein